MKKSKRTLLKSNKIAQLVLMEAKLLTEEKRILDGLILEGRKMEMAGYDQIFPYCTRTTLSLDCVQSNCRTHTTTRPAAKTSKPGALPVEIGS